MRSKMFGSLEKLPDNYVFARIFDWEIDGGPIPNGKNRGKYEAQCVKCGTFIYVSKKQRINKELPSPCPYCPSEKIRNI